MPRPPSNGFTLVELMLVLTIVGLASAAVVLAMPDPRGSLRTEAERLAARARMAQDSAIREGRPYALTLSVNGYGFERRRDGRWLPTAEPALDSRPWAPGVHADLREGSARTIFDPTGLADPLTLAISRENGTVTVRITSGGAIDIVG